MLRNLLRRLWPSPEPAEVYFWTCSSCEEGYVDPELPDMTWECPTCGEIPPTIVYHVMHTELYGLASFLRPIPLLALVGLAMAALIRVL